MGFNKFGNDPNKVCSKLEEHNTYFSLDYSGFDYNTIRMLIERAFDIIRFAFGVSRGDKSSSDRLLSWIEDEVTYTDVVWPDGRVVRLSFGIPSGSGFTAMLDSIINFIMLDEFFVVSEQDRSRRIYVNGDDGIVGVTFKGGHKKRTRKARETLGRMEEFMHRKFDSKLHAIKCGVATNLYVGYIKPKVPEEVLNGSSKKIFEFRRNLELSKGRKLTFDEKWENLEAEPGQGGSTGMTHRWSYQFDGRPKFLSNYFKKSGDIVTTLRPTREVVERLLKPERLVKDIDDHFGRISSAIVDNLNNRHVVNHMMHHALDAFYLKKSGIRKMKDLKDIEYKLKHGYSTPSWFNKTYFAKRGWYRRIDDLIDDYDLEEDFNPFWTELLNRAIKVNKDVYSGRGVEWNVIRKMRAGMITGPRTISGIIECLEGTLSYGDELRLCNQVGMDPVCLSMIKNPGVARGIAAKIMAMDRRGPFNRDSGWVLEISVGLAEIRVLHQKERSALSGLFPKSQV
jgi:hypothetical protein